MFKSSSEPHLLDWTTRSAREVSLLLTTYTKGIILLESPCSQLVQLPSRRQMHLEWKGIQILKEQTSFNGRPQPVADWDRPFCEPSWLPADLEELLIAEVPYTHYWKRFFIAGLRRTLYATPSEFQTSGSAEYIQTYLSSPQKWNCACNPLGTTCLNTWEGTRTNDW